MSQPTTPIEHPLVHAVEVVARGLDEATGANPVYLTTRQKERVLAALAREKARLEALEHRVLAAADDVAVEHPVLAEAYAAGQVSTAQVQVIGRALDGLPGIT